MSGEPCCELGADSTDIEQQQPRAREIERHLRCQRGNRSCPFPGGDVEPVSDLRLAIKAGCKNICLGIGMHCSWRDPEALALKGIRWQGEPLPSLLLMHGCPIDWYI